MLERGRGEESVLGVRVEVTEGEEGEEKSRKSQLLSVRHLHRCRETRLNALFDVLSRRMRIRIASDGLFSFLLVDADIVDEHVRGELCRR